MAKYKTLIPLLALAIFIIGGISTCDNGSKEKTAPTTTIQPSVIHSSPEQTSLEATPAYQIVGNSTNLRFDHAQSYFIAIDDVDLSNDDFKSKIKSILRDLSRQNRSDMFSARIFDDYPLAVEAYESETQNGSGGPEPERKANHFIAWYTGGIDFEAKRSFTDDAYYIDWFPATTTSDAQVGQYVGSELFRPQ